MSRQPEAIFGEKVDRDLRSEYGKDIWIENIQQVGKRGTPDRLICLKGKFIGLELKMEGGVIEPLQIVKLLEIKKAGGGAWVAYPSTWSLVFEEIKQAYGDI